MQAGVTEINFIEGKVTAPDGVTTKAMSDALKRYKERYVRSFVILCDSDVIIHGQAAGVEVMGKFTYKSRFFQAFQNQTIRRLFVDAPAGTKFSIIASTDPVAFAGGGREIISEASTDEYIIDDPITLVWTNVTTKGVKPDTDTEIDWRQADGPVAIQVRSTDPNNTATDIDLVVVTSPTAGGTYDDSTSYLTAVNIGDGVVRSFYVTPGPNFMKLRLNENGSLRADVTAIVTMRRRKG